MSDLLFMSRASSRHRSHVIELIWAYLPYFDGSEQTLIDLSWHGDISKLNSTTRIIPITPFGEVERTALGLTV